MSSLVKTGAANFCLLAYLACMGCGSGFSVPVLKGFSVFHSYGDSITAGSGLNNPARERYPSLIAEYNHLPLTDLALGGDQACDVSTRQIFPSTESPKLAVHGLYSLLISTNDVDVGGAGAYEQVFNLCHQASISWLALPAEYKMLATANSVNIRGSGFLETANHWNAWFTSERGASISFPLHLETAGPVYLWYRIVDGSPGAFTYALDGRVMGMLTTGTVPRIQTQNGSTDSLALLRLSRVEAGAHTLLLVQTSVGTAGAGVVAVGVPPGKGITAMPRVLVGTTPKQKAGTTAICALNDNICEAYISDIKENVALLAGDGLDVRIFDSRKYMSGTSSDLLDMVHPNAIGHMEIFYVLESSLN